MNRDLKLNLQEDLSRAGFWAVAAVVCALVGFLAGTPFPGLVMGGVMLAIAAICFGSAITTYRYDRKHPRSSI